MEADRRHPLGRLVSTVRFRITAVAAVAVLVVLGAAGLVVVAAQQRVLTNSLDETLEQGAASLGAWGAAGRMPAVLRGFGDDDAVAQVVDDDGRVLAATPNIAGHRPIAAAPPARRATRTRTVHGLPTDDATFRIVSTRVDAG